MHNLAVVSVVPIEERIYLVRGCKVMLDEDLARVYGVSTSRLNQQVSRNRERFPEDFMFQLTREETDSLMLQIAISKKGRGGRRKLPHVFTEYGAVMLSAVLRTPIAVHASIQIARAFIKLRQMVSANKELAKKLEQLERFVVRHDGEIRSLFDTIRRLMSRPDMSPSPIFREAGFNK